MRETDEKGGEGKEGEGESWFNTFTSASGIGLSSCVVRGGSCDVRTTFVA